MNVLILTTIMAPYRVSLFRELSKDFNLTVCFETKHDTSRNKLWYEEDTNHFKCIPLRNWDAPVGKIRWEITRMFSLCVPDVCIAYEYSTPTAMVFMQQCKFRHIPYLINCDGAFISKHWLKDRIKRYFISCASGCLANGTHAMEYFLHFGTQREKIHLHNFSTLYESNILPACMTTVEKADLKQRLSLQYKKTVISVGRFIPLKGFDVLLRAWSRMSPDYQLLLIGDGEEELSYRRYISENNISNITILPHQSFSAVLEYLKACDLFVLPTRSDVWGLVINEAMACGLPIITTDHCIAGLELVCNDENGFIVPVGDSDALAEKMRYILENDMLSSDMGQASLNKIRPYTIEKIARKLNLVLQKNFGG